MGPWAVPKAAWRSIAGTAFDLAQGGARKGRLFFICSRRTHIEYRIALPQGAPALTSDADPCAHSSTHVQ
jgi:hypothetical protein